ncbi:hypothetical protein GCM10010969_21340 [Saccharibacillus kuerlensis]|uniref:Uncharacterized protein n=1 Tax=Saccharibacillus kuerlensis TaxID=459527 RepID=A0ABQ2L2E5_9BACL|nr:hypothetical protein GCM10010969_21340 [Saccharibacillus kuerlensis]
MGPAATALDIHAPRLPITGTADMEITVTRITKENRKVPVDQPLSSGRQIQTQKAVLLSNGWRNGLFGV